MLSCSSPASPPAPGSAAPPWRVNLQLSEYLGVYTTLSTCRYPTKFSCCDDVVYDLAVLSLHILIIRIIPSNNYYSRRHFTFFRSRFISAPSPPIIYKVAFLAYRLSLIGWLQSPLFPIEKHEPPVPPRRLSHCES